MSVTRREQTATTVGTDFGIRPIIRTESVRLAADGFRIDDVVTQLNSF